MTSQLAEQIRKSGIVNSPVGDPEKGVGFRIDPAHPITQRTDTKPISKAEAAFRSVMMGLVVTAPITDRQSFDQADAILESGKAALHERAVSTFSATLEQTANSIPAEYMLEQVTRAVQGYEQKHDLAWVDTPEETVRRAAEARGYNPAEITGGRSEILLRDLEKLKLAMEEGKNVTSFEILQTFIFQTLGRYETTDGRIIAVWQDGEREYSSNQDAWEDIFTTQTLNNVMNEALATLAGSNADASDPATPPPNTSEPSESPTDAPSTPTEKPAPSPTPEIPTPEPVPTEQSDLNISEPADQVRIIEQTSQGDKYVYVDTNTMTPPEGMTMDGGRDVFLDNANTQREVLRIQGYVPGYTSVHVREDELVNTITTFDQKGENIFIPTITVDGKTFFSSSTSKAYFDVEIPEDAKPTYKPVELPPDTKPESVTVRFQGEAEILEVTDKFGNQWVWDFRKGEFVSMIDRPATAEMRTALPDYVAAYARTADAEQAELFSSPEAVMDRFEERTGTGKDGTPFKALVDPETNTILFLKTQNQETGEWEWEHATGDRLRELNNIDYTFLLLIPNDRSAIVEYAESMRLMDSNPELVISGGFDTEIVFSEFTTEDWNHILNNSTVILESLNSGNIPPELKNKMNWEIDDAVDFINTYFPESKIRVQHLLDGSKQPIESIKNGNFTDTQLMTLLEIMTKSRVVQYRDLVDTWDATDELVGGWVQGEVHNNGLDFWIQANGGDAANLANKNASWIKEVDPDAKVVVVETATTNFTNPMARWTIDAYTNRFLPNLDSSIIDGIIHENNMSVHNEPDYGKIQALLQREIDLGFEILGSEMMVMTDPIEWNDGGIVSKPLTPQQEELIQAEIYANMLKTYLNAGSNVMGFGSSGDQFAWTNWVTDYKEVVDRPSMFDADFKPKLAYFAINKLLSETLLIE